MEDSSGYVLQSCGPMRSASHYINRGMTINTEEKQSNNSNYSVNISHATSLSPNGEPGTSDVLNNPDGTPKQKRWYGPDGRAERDREET